MRVARVEELEQFANLSILLLYLGKRAPSQLNILQHPYMWRYSYRTADVECTRQALVIYASANENRRKETKENTFRDFLFSLCLSVSVKL